MKHPFFKVAVLTAAAVIIVRAVEESKEALKKAKAQAEADAALAEQTVSEALQAEEPETIL